MAVGDRTRRLLPAVLVSLALLLGLCDAARSAPSAGYERGPVSQSAVIPAVPAAEVHAARAALDVGGQPRLRWHRLADGKSPLLAASLLAALCGGLLLRWRPRSSVAGARVVGGRFARGSRAPPA